MNDTCLDVAKLLIFNYLKVNGASPKGAFR